MATQKIQIAARLPVETLNQLDSIAQDSGRSRSDVIEALVGQEAQRLERSPVGRSEGGAWSTADDFDRAVTNPDLPRLRMVAAVSVGDTLRLARLACESVFGVKAVPMASAVEVCRMMLAEHERAEIIEQVERSRPVVDDEEVEADEA
jgi:hypothetical protein